MVMLLKATKWKLKIYKLNFYNVALQEPVYDIDC